MGIGPFRREEYFQYRVLSPIKEVSVPPEGVSGNPDPLNYEVLRSQQVGLYQLRGTMPL